MCEESQQCITTDVEPATTRDDMRKSLKAICMKSPTVFEHRDGRKESLPQNFTDTWCIKQERELKDNP